MNVIVQSKSVKVTQGITLFAQKCLAKLLVRGYRISQIKVFIENIARKKNDGKSAIAKIEISLPGKVILVVGYAKTIYQAILTASRDAMRAVNKFREKRIKLRQLSPSLGDLAGEAAAKNLENAPAF